MNFSSLEYFTVVARERNFTRAAEQLHITQQTLSAHIAGLERELGCLLLLRRVPLELTYAGEVYLRYAQDLQKRLNSMRQEFSDITENRMGVLKIGVSFTRGHAIMPLLIRRFQKEYPRIAIQLVESSNDHLLEDLENGVTDLIIANLSESLPGIETRNFYREEVVLALSDELLRQYMPFADDCLLQKLRLGDLTALSGCPFLLNTRQDIAGRIGYDFLSRADIAAIPQVTSYNIETLLSICVQGLGACFCPLNLLERTLPPDQLRQLRVIRFEERADYWIHFGYRRQSYQWSIILQFMELALQLVPEL